jgi:tetratricopeptide (TPR) repeat protein
MKRSLLLIAASVLLLVALATVLRRRGTDGDKAASLSEGAERIRRFWKAYQHGAEARTGGDYEGAAGFFREALEIDPEHEDSLFYLAISLEESGRYLEAAETLSRLTTLNPESARGWSQLGSLLARRAPGNRPDPEAAEAAFVRAEEINREHSGPFLSRGALALDLGNLPEARRLFRIASDMSSPEGAFLAGLVAFLERNDAEAIQFFTRVLESTAREKAITGRGVASEGDVELSGRLTPLESAHLRALAFLYWTSRRGGRYPQDVPESFRAEIPKRLSMGRAVEAPSAKPDPADAECLEAGRLRPFVGTLVDTACSDYDADGKTDVFVLLWKKPGRLFRNDAAGFIDVTEEAGLGGVGGEGLSALFFDFDRDRDADLLVTAHAPLALSLRRLLSPEGRAKALTPRLFENQGGKRFIDVTAEVGLDRQFGVVEAEAFDVDSDGWLDLLFAMGGFEASHLEPSVVLRNRGGLEFVEWAHIPSSDEPRNALGVEAAKRNGRVEILLATRGSIS